MLEKHVISYITCLSLLINIWKNTREKKTGTLTQGVARSVKIPAPKANAKMLAAMKVSPGIW